jgi:hypothetical protein
MVQRATSRMESISGRLRARRPNSPRGPQKKDGSENVISRRFSKPSNPIGEGGGGSWRRNERMVIVQGFFKSNGKRQRNRGCAIFLGFFYSNRENFGIQIKQTKKEEEKDY